jgi:hypothetical protein
MRGAFGGSSSRDDRVGDQLRWPRPRYRPMDRDHSVRIAVAMASLLFISRSYAQEPLNSAIPAFAGNSKTTPMLRHDILVTLIPMFVARENCPAVESIDATFVGLDKDASGRVTGMLERWQAHGCGKSAMFEVQLTRTNNDQTNYLVTPVRTNP